MRQILATMTFAFGLTGLAAPSLAATQYPLTVTNCGQQVTFEKAPSKVVSIGQGM
ncbi:ABC transporter substrate-binding protein, partial [Rhizobium ruizarguesonis]